MTAPTLLTIARRALAGEAKLERGATLLVAVSGGPDSMALLDVLATLGHRIGVQVHAHGVDHGLREGASAELDLAAAWAARRGVPFGRTRVTVPRGGNLQARARAARYGALAEAARRCGARAIATAHHADDRAETLLIRLLRGAGPAGLAVLPARAPLPRAEGECEGEEGEKGTAGEGLELVRPLLRARRADVHAHLARHQIPFAHDPSNDDPRFLRTRVRRELLPLLVELSPGIVGHLEALADQLASEEAGPRLPRPTQRALAELMRSRSPKASVLLPGGLVVTTSSRPARAQKHTPDRKRG